MVIDLCVRDTHVIALIQSVNTLKNTAVLEATILSPLHLKEIQNST